MWERLLGNPWVSTDPPKKLDGNGYHFQASQGTNSLVFPVLCTYRVFLELASRSRYCRCHVCHLQHSIHIDIVRSPELHVVMVMVRSHSPFISFYLELVYRLVMIYDLSLAILLAARVLIVYPCSHVHNGSSRSSYHHIMIHVPVARVGDAERPSALLFPFRGGNTHRW